MCSAVESPYSPPRRSPYMAPRPWNCSPDLTSAATPASLTVEWGRCASQPPPYDHQGGIVHHPSGHPNGGETPLDLQIRTAATRIIRCFLYRGFLSLHSLHIGMQGRGEGWVNLCHPGPHPRSPFHCWATADRPPPHPYVCQSLPTTRQGTSTPPLPFDGGTAGAHSLTPYTAPSCIERSDAPPDSVTLTRQVGATGAPPPYMVPPHAT